MIELLSISCETRHHDFFFINSLWPSDAICQHRPQSILARAMACCLTAPCRDMNQHWLIINGVLWRSPKTNLTILKISIHKMSLKNTLVKSLPHLTQGAFSSSIWHTYLIQEGLFGFGCVSTGQIFIECLQADTETGSLALQWPYYNSLGWLDW